MKYRELANLDIIALEEELEKYKKELLNLRFQKALGELANSARIRQVKKTVARIKTKLQN